MKKNSASDCRQETEYYNQNGFYLNLVLFLAEDSQCNIVIRCYQYVVNQTNFQPNFFVCHRFDINCISC